MTAHSGNSATTLVLSTSPRGKPSTAFMQRQLARLGLITFGASLASCGSIAPADGNVDDDPASVTEVQGGLAAQSYASWEAWPMPLNVCFKRYSIPPEAGQATVIPELGEYERLKAIAIDTLNATWGLAPGVSFVNRGDCPYNGTALPIELKYGPGWGGSCGFGKTGGGCELGGATSRPCGPGETQCADIEGNEDFFRRILVHEVGHGLGFVHEHQRPGPDNPSCLGIYVHLLTCESCLSGIRAGTGCQAADWNHCESVPAADHVATTQWFPIDPPDCGQPGKPTCGPYSVIQSRIDANLAIIPSAELLTPYDPWSVTSYCAIGDGLRADTDFHPTPYDLLGAEMTYPPSTTFPLGCQKGCFHTATGVVTRADGAVTSSWTERGALGIDLISPVNGQAVPSLGTSSLPAGTSTLTFPFRAPRLQHHLGDVPQARRTAQGTLLNSSAAHTALLTSLM